MIRRLIILLLIVGCAPTKPPAATFHIGMTETEFDKLNSNVKITKNEFTFFNTQSYIEGEKTIGFNTYYYGFRHDTLFIVSKGILNLSLTREIDYDKYATPPE